MSNLEYWEKLKRPPASALKQIKGGRLSGMTDISPMWRYQAMTEQFGPVGEGWKYEIVKLWLEPATDEQVMAFAEIRLCVRYGDVWSDPIPGIGGSAFIAKEKGGLHSSDECYKMAITDALSVAMKMVGVGADIYMGAWDGSKYRNNAPEASQTQNTPQPPYTPTSKSTPQDATGGGLAHWKKAASDECDTPEELVAWWNDNSMAIGALLPKEKKELIDHCAKLKADMIKPPTVECPLGGEKTKEECEACTEDRCANKNNGGSNAKSM